MRLQAGEKKREVNLVLNGRIKWRARTSTAVLCAAYVVINTAYSLVGPFFPLSVRLYIIMFSTNWPNQYVICSRSFFQAKKKGSNSLLTGVIISCAPFSVFALSPIFGYSVRHG